MATPLTHPWFDAHFFAGVKKDTDGRYSYRYLREDGSPYSYVEAQGVMLWCPCGYGKPEYQNEARPHMILVPFRDRGLPEDFGPESSNSPGTHPRWGVSGSSLSDLSTTPSIAVGKPECWHSYITNGMVV